MTSAKLHAGKVGLYTWPCVAKLTAKQVQKICAEIQNQLTGETCDGTSVDVSFALDDEKAINLEVSLPLGLGETQDLIFVVDLADVVTELIDFDMLNATRLGEMRDRLEEQVKRLSARVAELAECEFIAELEERE